MSKQNKKVIYYSLWVFAGLLMSVLVIGMLQLLSLMYGFSIQPEWLSVTVFFGILLLGLLFGIWAGVESWTKIYEEGARGEKYIKDHKDRIENFEKKLFSGLKGLTIDTLMKWTITLFLLYMMVIVTVFISAVLVEYLKLHVDGTLTNIFATMTSL